MQWLLRIYRKIEKNTTTIGLKNLHELGYVHKDLHSGNILLQDKVNAYITDFGLAGPANKQISDIKIYGVLPYIAPEVLNKEVYTKASDIYSFGAIMAELSAGRPPFYDKKLDMTLALDICNGLRPEFGKGTPEFYKKIAYRCNFYNYGKVIKKDINKAFEWYNKSAEQEYSNAQNDLGYFYEKGICIQKNEEKAFYWYQKSANNKNNIAQCNLAICYRYGLGIKKNIGLYYLHNEGILHRDLHSKNIVIHENNAKITDFGISKIENNSTMHIGPCGKIAYIEPQILINREFQYIKLSDIYSYGVLMWEISSGCPPFKECHDIAIRYHIVVNKAHINLKTMECNDDESQIKLEKNDGKELGKLYDY
ncbi:15749_t:CDS:2 [Funneliformis geosporum]|nr:15749_t:CDS:2 [Funneliformis geosporum]